MSSNEVCRLLPPPGEYFESFSIPKPLGVRINKFSFRVTYVETNSPLSNRAFVGDQLVTIDRQPLISADLLAKKLAEKSRTVIVKFRHAFFSYCTYLGPSVERLQLEKDLVRSTGRAVNLFTIHFYIPNLPREPDDDGRLEILKFGVRYDARERVQVAYCAPDGLAGIHLKAGDIIKDVNDHPICSKTMLKLWISEAVAKGETVQMNVERLFSGDDALRDVVETSQDVVNIAQKQIHAIRSKTLVEAPKVLTRKGTTKKGSIKLADKPIECDIYADHDPNKLKPCKGSKQ